MAIIASSTTFEGQIVSRADAGRILRSDVKTINFKDKAHSDGVYLFILPGYKADSQGRGVWSKYIQVRANFGTSDKERFLESADSPIAYFDNQCKHKFAEYAKVIDSVNDKGQKTKIYPPHGNLTKRVLYNVALAQSLHEGAHVIEVPTFGVSDAISKYHSQPLFSGGYPTCVADHTQATPVFFWLNMKSNGMPWQVTPEPSQKMALPLELADTDYLYNLDDVCDIPSNESLYEKLRSITRSDVFEACMQGYGVTGAVNVGFQRPAAAPAMAGVFSGTPTGVAAAPVAAPIAKPIAKPIARPNAAPVQQAAASLPEVTTEPAERMQAPAASNPSAGGLPTNVAAWLKPKAA